ncbi:hypothetical protein E4T43_07165 [Aureobasidium subglaciale]|nr:hypothetical protein E4T43_07165 [Aureobasidium subglaciale]
MFFLISVLLSFLVFVSGGPGERLVALPVRPPVPEARDSCIEALNTLISCPEFLRSIGVNYVPFVNMAHYLRTVKYIPDILSSNSPLDLDHLKALCTPSCNRSPHAVLETIKSNCEAPQDVVVVEGDTYPASFILDRFIYTYDSSRRRDSTTGQLCDELFASWWSDPSSAPDRSTKDCSDCLLGLGQIHLNSPFGFDENFAEDVASQTSSCSQYGYAFTTPGPYTLETSTRTSTEPYHATPWSRPL